MLGEMEEAEEAVYLVVVVEQLDTTHSGVLVAVLELAT
jgi:hypothetical protein